MPFKQVNGSNYYYEIHGNGHPVILISGYTCDHTLWNPIIEMLSKHYQVLTFDNRGCGQTKDNKHPLTLHDMAKDTIDLAESLGLKKPHIMGQSMGGMIAQILGAEFGSRIGKLMLLVTTCKLRKATILGLRSLLDMRRHNLPFDEIFYATIAWVFGETFLSDKKIVQILYDIFKGNLHPQSLEDQKRQFVLLETFDGSRLKILVPTLVISGEEDVIVLPDEAEKLAKNLKASHKMLKGAHGVIAEDSEGLVNTIHQFLK